MTIEVTGCHDCPLKTVFNQCIPLGKKSVHYYIIIKELHPSCPLKQETITIKLKSDEPIRQPHKGD